ncbi:CBO0543 family protein [Pseudalkalibacillus decolorationis]|uniref:CBO0543 family protein n=1 Tax=Pseudalkalibacillus decolorationis TaxID=163879 RepID=UPI00214843B5|nr:CBO0543 family protein [Pseudalkalibacillus decolorationis]
MERVILWGLLIIGIALLLYSLRKLPFKEWLFVYLLTTYFSIIIGTIVVEENMLDYPIKFLNKHFDSSLLYEYLLFPVVCLYFYRTTYHSRYFNILLQGGLYTTALTIIEVLLERYTDLIKYNSWTWIYTFTSVFILLVFIRIIVQLIYKEK